uniref:Uncharacterized protein n=1 Tax=Anguilla anguilla TaxID=7936 RepID=A0A0E9WB76_ANGAN
MTNLFSVSQDIFVTRYIELQVKKRLF